MSSPKFSKHALWRWGQRFPGLDPMEQIARADARVTRRIRRLLRERCPRHHAQIKTGNKRTFYLMTPDGIVFVMAPPATVVTVLDLRDAV